MGKLPSREQRKDRRRVVRSRAAGYLWQAVGANAALGVVAMIFGLRTSSGSGANNLAIVLGAVILILGFLALIGYVVIRECILQRRLLFTKEGFQLMQRGQIIGQIPYENLAQVEVGWRGEPAHAVVEVSLTRRKHADTWWPRFAKSADYDVVLFPEWQEPPENLCRIIQRALDTYGADQLARPRTEKARNPRSTEGVEPIPPRQIKQETADDPPTRRERSPVNPWILVGIGGGVLAVIVLITVIVLTADSGGTLPNNLQPQGNAGENPDRKQAAWPGRELPQPPPATKFPGLLAYWTFDGEEAKRGTDVTGNGHDGVLTKLKIVKGVRGEALEFNGAGTRFTYGLAPGLNFAANAPFTIAAWMRTTVPQGVLVSQRNRKEGGADIEIGIAGGRLQAFVREDRGDQIGLPERLIGPKVHDGDWHHFALTRNAGSTIELFVDGAACAQLTGKHTGGAITTDLRALGAELYWLRTKARGNYPNFDGAIDEFCIFSRALAIDEIRALAGR